MTAPTTVSALLHAAAMVTAGIFLLLRFTFSITNNPFLFLSTSLTTLLGIVAIIKSNLKKIIAFSTTSQLG